MDYANHKYVAGQYEAKAGSADNRLQSPESRAFLSHSTAALDAAKAILQQISDEMDNLVK